MADYYVKSNFPIISAITKANPGQVTTIAAHGLTTGDIIAISGVGGMTEVNNLPFTVTVVDSNNFTVGVDTTGYTTYTGSGYVHPGANAATYRGPWLASHTFTAGARVISNTVSSIRMHECTTGGTSGAAQPTFNTTAGSTTADNEVVWTTRLPTTWANAFLSLARTSGLAANDVVYISNNHVESAHAATTIGTPSVFFVCVNDAQEPPTTDATTAIVKTTGANGLAIGGGNSANGYYKGIVFEAGTGATATNITLGNASAVTGVFFWFKDCSFRLLTTATTSRIVLPTMNSTFVLSNAEFKFSNASQRLSVSNGTVITRGGSIASGSSAVSAFLEMTGTTLRGRSDIAGFDFTNASNSMNVFESQQTQGAAYGMARNCKMPASWTGSVLSGDGGANITHRFAAYNCDSADTNYRLIIKTFHGTITSDTGVYNNAGATNGTTPLSWKVATTTNATRFAPMITDEIVRWNETTGSAVTATVQFLHNSTTALKDNEVWLEVQYLGISGFPMAVFAYGGDSFVFSPANQAASSATWTSPGVTNPNAQQLSVTFTPQEKGFVHARVYVAKPSYTVYVDPKLTLS